MIKKLLCVILVSAALLTNAYAAEYENTLNELRPKLTEDPENGCFLTLAIRQNDPFADLSEFGCYIASLEVPKNKTTALKYALTLYVCGVKSEKYEKYLSDAGNYPENTAGIVFRLHLLSNGIDVKAEAEELISVLSARQREDGGFAVAGDASDVDLTAMVIASLAPYKAEAEETVEKAVSFIESAQTESGAFNSFGGENAETCAQVVIALSSIGERGAVFEKALSVMKTFEISDGKFEHVHGGGENNTATAQCLCALVSADFGKPFYKVEPGYAFTLYKESEKTENTGDLTLVFCLAFAFIGITVCVVFIIRKKRRAVDYIIIVSITAAAVIITSLAGVKTGEGYFSGDDKIEITGYITISADCSLVSDKTILPPYRFGIGKGETAYSAIVRACRENGLTVINSGTALSPYVEAIGGLYEAEYGQTSGWGYKVNGYTPSVGAGSYVLSDGDVLEWIYVPDVSYLYDGGEK